MTLTLGNLTPAGARSFGVVVSVGTGGVCGMAALLAGFPAEAPMAGIPTGLLVLAAGLWRPALFRLAFRGWNCLVRAFGRFASLAVSAVCYFVIFVATGLPGSTLKMERRGSGESLWTARALGNSRPTRSPHFSEEGERRELMGIRALLDWAWYSGNWWAVTLTPVVAMLRAFEADRREEVPAHIYTLF